MPKTLYTSNADLTRDKKFTFLSEDVVISGTTLRVQSIVGFESLSTSSGQILIIGELGAERTEITKTSSGTGPSAHYKEITLASGLSFDHPQDTKVTIADWDRVEIQHASTVTGSKSTIMTYPLRVTPDQIETQYTDTTKTSGYYFVRFNETVGNTTSDWSDPIPYGGFDENTVASIKERALDQLGEEVVGQLITHEFLNRTLWEARREYHNAPGKRPFRKKLNISIGNVITGSSRIELPTDVEAPYTAENIYGVRIGTNDNLRYYDKKEWDFDWVNKARSTLDLPYTAGTSTSIWLASGRDFSDSATISVEGTTIGLSRVTGETNSFYIYDHGSWSASAGSEAFENASPGLPSHFTVIFNSGGSAYIAFDRPLETAYVNQNITADYYTKVVAYNSDADVLDEPQYDMYVHYLKAMIKSRKSRGEFNLQQDSDWQEWDRLKKMALQKEYIGAEIKLRPDIEHLEWHNS